MTRDEEILALSLEILALREALNRVTECLAERKFEICIDCVKLSSAALSRPASAYAEKAEAVMKALGGAWELLAAWRPIGWVDHACRECVPQGEIVKDGFVCAYHAAKNAAMDSREGAK